MTHEASFVEEARPEYALRIMNTQDDSQDLNWGREIPNS